MLNDCKLQSQVKLMQLWSYDEDADEVHPGENVKMKVSGVEEEVNYQIYRGSYMSAHVLLNLLNEFGKRDKM